MTAVHVVGAGLAGLSAALRAAESGGTVTIHEAAPVAGGRARSFFDATLGRTVDNGNHLMLSGNASVMAYLQATGGMPAVTVSPDAAFPFHDLARHERWTVRLGGGWFLDPDRRVPGAGAAAHLALIRLMVGRRHDTVAQRLSRRGPLYDRFVEPLAVACINADPADASAGLLARVLAESVLRGAAACRPVVARDGLSAALVDPALRRLSALGVRLAFGRRLRRLEIAAGSVRALVFDGDRVPLADGDRVVLAVPPPAAAALVPGLAVPEEVSPIVNVHFALPEPVEPPFEGCFVGLIGGTGQWLFLRAGVASVTVSAAHRLVDWSAEAIADAVWPDVVQALGLPAATPMPAVRVLKEKRATFAQTPAQAARRPGPGTGVRGLLLAGDWTATRLPATLEGAVRSGERAARLAAGARDLAA